MITNLLAQELQAGKIEKCLIKFVGKRHEPKTINLSAMEIRKLFSEYNQLEKTEREAREAKNEKMTEIRDLVDEILDGGAA